MYLLSLALYFFLALLLVDGVIELAFVSSMVGWLHRRAGGTFEFYWNGREGNASFGQSGYYHVSGRPQYLIVDQGHTSNGAAGTAIIIVGLGGILVLCLRHFSPTTFRGRLGTALYYFWLVFTVLSALLSLTALIYTFAVTNKYAGQGISESVAALGNGRNWGSDRPYFLGFWTPENWYTALLRDLELIDSDRQNIRTMLLMIRGWRWNLIPLFMLGFVVACLAWVESFKRKEELTGTARYQAAPKRNQV